jgi:hypothetical protein
MLVGAFLLFKLRKSAVMVFGFLLVFTVFRDLIRYLTSDMTKALGSATLALAATFLGWLIEAAIFFYALRLRGRGVLT